MLLAVFGAVIIAAAAVDFVGTTLSAGGGFLTGRLARLFWRPAGLLRRRAPHLAAIAMGPAFLFGVFVIWLGLFWIGWLLIFGADPASVVASQTGQPASLSERVYYVGFTLSTLGVGDFIPHGSPWRILTAVAAFNGFAAITLSITYFLTIVNAATKGRALAREIHSLGGSGDEIVARGWDGQGFDAAVSSLMQLRPSLFQHGDQCKTFPITYYFGERGEASLAEGLAGLLDAVIILESGVAPHVRPQRLRIAGLRQAVATVVPSELAGRSSMPAPALAMPALRAMGVPLGDDRDLQKALAANESLRRRVRAWARHESAGEGRRGR